MPEESARPLQFRDMQILEMQQKIREEAEHVVRAFSLVVNGEGRGVKPSEEELAGVRDSMREMQEMCRSLPTDPLDDTRKQNIQTALTTAKSMIWGFLSDVQRMELFPEEINLGRNFAE